MLDTKKLPTQPK